ncbi:MAG: DUF2147 domain-containing protein [Mucilaginibacter sp.]|uniref:DUF2147 domain-containing protein n=1 Tax=Mucilaginibacter sp. TaxID=1882438 RepID=UPI003267289F
MPIKALLTFILFSQLTVTSLIAGSIPAKARICGKWEATEKNLIITVSMVGNQYKAVITWFSDVDGKPMDYWKDSHNPNPALRNRKIHGLNILRNLTYHPNTNSWEDGMIYDSKHGKEWNASIFIDNKGLLRVKGYWHLKFIGKTMSFYRVT